MLSPFEFDNTNYSERLFEKIDCNSVKIQEESFENCRFKGCSFNDATFRSCKFIDCDFTDCVLNTIIVINTTFSGVVFENSKLMGVNWSLAKWPQIRLTDLINFYSCDISHSSFYGLSLAEINIQECKAHDVDFREVDLSYGNLTNTDFHKSLFIKTNLMGADLSNAINYDIDIGENSVKKAIFSFPDAINLLRHIGIKVNGLPDDF